jgi:hypothetical protein
LIDPLEQSSFFSLSFMRVAKGVGVDVDVDVDGGGDPRTDRQ